MDWFDSREDMAEHIAKKDEHVNPAMTSATALRIEIEHALERRFPAALTPAPRTIREVASTGIQSRYRKFGQGFKWKFCSPAALRWL